MCSACFAAALRGFLLPQSGSCGNSSRRSRRTALMERHPARNSRRVAPARGLSAEPTRRSGTVRRSSMYARSGSSGASPESSELKSIQYKSAGISDDSRSRGRYAAQANRRPARSSRWRREDRDLRLVRDLPLEGTRCPLDPVHRPHGCGDHRHDARVGAASAFSAPEHYDGGRLPQGTRGVRGATQSHVRRPGR